MSAVEDIKEVKEADHITSCEIISEKVQESESCADQCKEIDVLVGEAQITVDASNNDIQQLVETEVMKGDESIHSTDNITEKIVEDVTNNEKKDHETVNPEKLDKNEDSICTPSDECKAESFFWYGSIPISGHVGFIRDPLPPTCIWDIWGDIL